jgi:hypothetical protein
MASYELIDADTKEIIASYESLASAQHFARSWTNAPPIHGRMIRAIEIWHVVYTRTQEHVGTVERNQPEAADRK